MQHYFTQNPKVKSEKKEIFFTFLDNKYTFFTDNGVFQKTMLT